MPATSMDNLIPIPVHAKETGGEFILIDGTAIYVEPAATEIINIGQYLADKLNPPTGFGMQVIGTSGAPADGNIYLTTRNADEALGQEGYQLSITPGSVSLVAHQPAGLFRGVQTIRQLLPAAIESSTVQPGPWTLACGMVRDYPRYEWRGFMLDVARHFFSVADVKRVIDLIAYYKMNRIHLHLTDDQGWRIMINSWPALATYGGSTGTGESPGGYYTQAEYADIVAYAQNRYIMVIPEIDMPGHTNAALASYAELNCDLGKPPLYTGTEVGFSSLCIDKDITLDFVRDVIGEIASLTPGPYIHIGGDEAFETSATDYTGFVEQAQAIVESYGKRTIGWEEIAQANLLNSTVVQHWSSGLAQFAVQQGTKVIMSPASRAYLDMKYNGSTPLGQDWAGHVDVENAYSWDPARQVAGVTESDVLGIEAPLWSETLQTIADIEFMAFPRLPGYAEIGWSQPNGRHWNEYKDRLGAHAPRLVAMGVNFYRSPKVAWL